MVRILVPEVGTGLLTKLTKLLATEKSKLGKKEWNDLFLDEINEEDTPLRQESENFKQNNKLVIRNDDTLSEINSIDNTRTPKILQNRRVSNSQLARDRKGPSLGIREFKVNCTL